MPPLALRKNLKKAKSHHRSKLKLTKQPKASRLKQSLAPLALAKRGRAKINLVQDRNRTTKQIVQTTPFQPNTLALSAQQSSVRNQQPYQKGARSLTFWADLESTYFRKIEPVSDADEILDTVRESSPTQDLCHRSLLPPPSSSSQGPPQLQLGQASLGGTQCPLRPSGTNFYSEFFSFFDYYQEMIKELGELADYADPEEVRLLRKAQVIDQHVIQQEDLPSQQGHKTRAAKEQPAPLNLLGYQMSTCQENPFYATDYFGNQYNNRSPSHQINDQLEWLEAELKVTRKQIKTNKVQLKTSIHQKQKEENEIEEQFKAKSQNSKLSQHFSQTMIHLEMIQIAESVTRIIGFRKLQPERENDIPDYFKKKYFHQPSSSSSSAAPAIKVPVSIKGKEFLLSFDDSIDMPATWVNPFVLSCFNHLREELYKKLISSRGVTSANATAVQWALAAQAAEEAAKRSKSKLGAPSLVTATNTAPSAKDEMMSEQQTHRDQLRKIGYEVEGLDFCHHCMQLKQGLIHAKCRYKSSKHRMFYPSSTHINGVKIYNAEPQFTNLINTLILKKLVKDKKRRATFEDKMEFSCDRKYCSFCLKNYYDIILSDVKNDPNWNCPYCTGQCFCSRCRRQDQLTNARGYLVSLNMKEVLFKPQVASKLLSTTFHRSQNPFDVKIKTNFESTVRSCDLTQSGRQMASQIFKSQNLVGDDHIPFFLESDISAGAHLGMLLQRSGKSQMLGAGSVVQQKPDAWTVKLKKRLRSELEGFVRTEHAVNFYQQNELQTVLKGLDSSQQSDGENQQAGAASRFEEESKSGEPLKKEKKRDQKVKAKRIKEQSQQKRGDRHQQLRLCETKLMQLPAQTPQWPLSRARPIQPHGLQLSDYSLNTGNCSLAKPFKGRNSTGSTSPTRSSKINKIKIGRQYAGSLGLFPFNTFSSIEKD